MSRGRGNWTQAVLAECCLQTDAIDPGEPWQNHTEKRFNAAGATRLMCVLEFPSAAGASGTLPSRRAGKSPPKLRTLHRSTSQRSVGKKLARFPNSSPPTLGCGMLLAAIRHARLSGNDLLR